MITTDVLVVGCGPSGLVAALALARSGVAVLAITKHSELSPTPRAHLTNQRSLEVLADLGVGDTARALAIPYSFMPDASFMRSLTGDEFGRMRGLGADYEGLSNSRQASPYEVSDLPQHILEPMLFGAAVKAGCHVRFDTELVTFDQDGEGVTAVLRDRLSDERMDVWVCKLT